MLPAFSSIPFSMYFNHRNSSNIPPGEPVSPEGTERIEKILQKPSRETLLSKLLLLREPIGVLHHLFFDRRILTTN